LFRFIVGSDALQGEGVKEKSLFAMVLKRVCRVVNGSEKQRLQNQFVNLYPDSPACSRRVT
jgi:hypothetical protein